MVVRSVFLTVCLVNLYYAVFIFRLTFVAVISQSEMTGVYADSVTQRPSDSVSGRGRICEMNCDNGDKYCARMSSIGKTDARTDGRTGRRACVTGNMAATGASGG